MEIPYTRLQDLATALEDHGNNQWFWDRKTGELLLYSEDLSLAEMGYNENPEDDPDRFLLIEPIDSRTGFRCMEQFVEDLPDGECKRSLIRALRGPRPFASFRNVIDDFGEQRKQWFDYHDNWLLKEAKSFIEDNDLGKITGAPK